MNLVVEHLVNPQGAGLLKLIGVLDIYTIEKFNQEIAKLGPMTSLTIDFSELDFLDSTGIGGLLQIIFKSNEQNFSIDMTGISPEMEDIFEVVGLYQILKTIQKDG